MRMIHMEHTRWLTMNILPVLGSVAVDMTFLIVLHMMCMGALSIVLGCLVSSFHRMYQTEAWERAFGSMRYVESDSQMSIMSQAFAWMAWMDWMNIC